MSALKSLKTLDEMDFLEKIKGLNHSSGQIRRNESCCFSGKFRAKLTKPFFNMEHRYMIGLHSELEEIFKNGIPCDKPGQQNQYGVPLETTHALERGWDAPEQKELDAPRIFMWMKEPELDDPRYNSNRPTELTYQAAKQNGFKIDQFRNGDPAATYAALRIPLFILTTQGGKEFPDGSIPDQTRHYMIFPDKKVGETVIKGEHIAIRHGGEWVRLSDYMSEKPEVDAPEKTSPMEKPEAKPLEKTNLPEKSEVVAPEKSTPTVKAKAKNVKREIWKMTEPLMRWNGWTSWTLGHSFEHAFGFGRTGSAKSSTLIQFASKAALLAGYGCLFQTTKKNDTATYLKWIKEAGRSDSLVMIDTKRGLGCNLIKQELDYSVTDTGAIEEDTTENIVRLFKFVSTLGGGTNEKRGNESIWDAAAKQLLRNALNVVYAATGTVEFDDLRQLVQSAPTSRSEAEDAAWNRDSRCGQLLEEAQKRKPGSSAVEMARQYFLVEFPRLAPETRTSVTFNFSVEWADLLARDPLRSLFFAKTDYTMDILLQGAVIVVDLPVDDKSEIGRLANGLARWAAQRAVLRRNDLTGNRKAARPVAIIWDECQKTLTMNDVDFQATAREQRCMVLAATQTIGFLRSPIGRNLGDGFIGNFNTKVFYQNQDPDTNQYMADAIGKIWVTKTVSETRDAKGRKVPTKAKVEEYAFPPQAAQKLKTGGDANDGRVTAILTRGGQQFGGKPGMVVKFWQPTWRWGYLNLITCSTAVCAKQRPAPDFRRLR
jgi:hypothetical protein